MPDVQRRALLLRFAVTVLQLTHITLQTAPLSAHESPMSQQRMQAQQTASQSEEVVCIRGRVRPFVDRAVHQQ